VCFAEEDAHISIPPPDFWILIEPVLDTSSCRDAEELEAVPVGACVHSLDWSTFAAEPRLTPVEGDAVMSPDALWLEPIRLDRPTLLLVAPPGLSLRVNGRAAARLELLDVGDQIQLGELLLHVTRRRHVDVGPPAVEHLSKRCGVCRLPIREDTEVIVHDACGSVLHLEPESRPASERLACALLGCPSCDAPVSLGSGYVWLPEL
jgi:hypothetical protein